MNVQQTSENLDELKMLDDIYIEKNNSLQLEKQKADEFAKLSGNLKNDANTNENKSIISPTAVSVSYTASNARYYGWWFGDHYENYIFKRASLDCTNFVSQCIWSGYGGTNDYDISTIGDYSSAYDVPAAQALRKRALDNYRQTSQWYGRYYDSIYGDPISSFCGVQVFGIMQLKIQEQVQKLQGIVMVFIQD